MSATFTLRKGKEEYHLCWRLEDCRELGSGMPAALPFHDRISALYFLRGFTLDSLRSHELRVWLQNQSPIADDALVHAATLMASGVLMVATLRGGPEGEMEGILRKGEGAGGARRQENTQATPLQDEMARRSAAEAETIVLGEPEEEPEKTWIEIELIDKNGRPVPFERFKLTLPDGSVKWGRLDGDAKARVERLQPGTCQVTFPDRDEEVWEVE